jgi:hypothetical protein
MGKTPAFTGKKDIGKTALPGYVQFDSSNGIIKLTGSGENMWENQDAFFFMWDKIEGDCFGKADIAWEDAGKNPHCKAGWMIRAGLDPDDAYADAVVHGDGLISLQYRKTKGGATSEIQSPLRGAKAISFERTGNQFTMSVSDTSGIMHPIGNHHRRDARACVCGSFCLFARFYGERDGALFKHWLQRIRSCSIRETSC